MLRTVPYQPFMLLVRTGIQPGTDYFTQSISPHMILRLYKLVSDTPRMWSLVIEIDVSIRRLEQSVVTVSRTCSLCDHRTSLYEVPLNGW